MFFERSDSIRADEARLLAVFCNKGEMVRRTRHRQALASVKRKRSESLARLIGAAIVVENMTTNWV